MAYKYSRWVSDILIVHRIMELQRNTICSKSTELELVHGGTVLISIREVPINDSTELFVVLFSDSW